MDNAQDKPVVILSESSVDKSAALFRRAARATKASQLLITQTEQLLEKTRQLFGTSHEAFIPK